MLWNEGAQRCRGAELQSVPSAPGEGLTKPAAAKAPCTQEEEEAAAGSKPVLMKQDTGLNAPSEREASALSPGLPCLSALRRGEQASLPS